MRTVPQRLNWIDWMKTIGMYVIIIGHTFPVGFCPFIYSFSVPLFFFISGFLNKPEKDWHTLLIKIVHTLLIPYLLICLCNFIIYFLTDDCTWTLKTVFWKIVYMIGGMHNLFQIKGCGSMWFVYSLIIIRILWQWCHASRYQPIIIITLCMLGTLSFNHFIGKGFGWAVSNVMLAFPYYYIGMLFESRIRFIKNSNKKNLFNFIQFIGGVMALYYLSEINDTAYMYLGWYGNYLLLFYLNGTIGIYLVIILSWTLDNLKIEAITTISMGTILILGFHEQLLPILEHLSHFNMGVHPNLLKALFSLSILLLFIPIIHAIKRWCPIFLGKR